MPESWMVVRGDDNGQNFIVEDGMTEQAASKRYGHLLRGHKQWYDMWRYDLPEQRTDLIARYNLKE